MEQTEWAPQRAALIAAAAGGCVMAVLAVILRSEPAGIFLTGLAAALLLGVATAGFLARPRLAVRSGHRSDTASAKPIVQFHSFLGKRYALSDDEIERVRLVHYPRWGRRVPMLEIELRAPADRLIILSRWDLGTEPHTVIHALAQHGVSAVELPAD
ncbi:PH domain-containing protein [Hoyosella sp. YIM 151337]|uniref:PH domain-containing protein n=1 Tax=Hoyosella sp. YIM 151337 TaxID=2992742 RepID=UPI0022361F40|nr:PH domain-containing protein [Hoyosella sp. YIM 151337]MCW4354772.1 PH domain-containing protein [Hoyosella sp. YIM 151337]